MLELLPQLSDQARAAVAWWAGLGAAVGFGGWLINFVVNYHRRPPRRAQSCDRPGVEVPGHKGDDGGRAGLMSPQAAVGVALVGAVAGGLIGLGIDGPEGLNDRLELLGQLLAVASAAFVLTRIMRDTRPVGEAPPEDPDGTLAARLPWAVVQLALAAFMLALVWFTLD